MPALDAVPALVVGFDLDLTLVDSGDAIVAAIRYACAAHGVDPPERDLRTVLGLPLDQVLPRYLPHVPYPDALAAYRRHYRAHGVPASTALPGARAALAAVREHGGRVVVVSAKHTPVVRAVLQAAGLEADQVAGELFGADKAAALRQHAAAVYVGDHPGDVAGARAAGAVAVAVATGPAAADELAAAGADVVLPDLTSFPDWLAGWVLDARLADLADRLRGYGSVLVAFSGGVDSALLLAAAVRALGPDRVVAATAQSAALAAGEGAAAAAVAAALGVRHVTVDSREQDRPGYRANGPDRCAHCKAELLEVLAPLAAELRLAAVATGTNADDVVAGFRPGIAAAARLGAVTPLADAGLTKAQVRTAARRWGLAVWDKPQLACLASRVAYGIPVTPARLARVDRAETGLRRALAGAGIPVTDLRVRDLGDRARVEVDQDRVAEVAAWGRAAEVVRAAGFGTVELDRRGFRSGSLNEVPSDGSEGPGPAAAAP